MACKWVCDYFWEDPYEWPRSTPPKKKRSMVKFYEVTLDIHGNTSWGSVFSWTPIKHTKKNTSKTSVSVCMTGCLVIYIPSIVLCIASKYLKYFNTDTSLTVELFSSKPTNIDHFWLTHACSGETFIFHAIWVDLDLLCFSAEKHLLPKSWLNHVLKKRLHPGKLTNDNGKFQPWMSRRISY